MSYSRQVDAFFRVEPGDEYVPPRPTKCGLCGTRRPEFMLAPTHLRGHELPVWLCTNHYPGDPECKGRLERIGSYPCRSTYPECDGSCDQYEATMRKEAEWREIREAADSDNAVERGEA